MEILRKELIWTVIGKSHIMASHQTDGSKISESTSIRFLQPEVDIVWNVKFPFV